jgi:hypothetical protein
MAGQHIFLLFFLTSGKKVRIQSYRCSLYLYIYLFLQITSVTEVHFMNVQKNHVTFGVQCLRFPYEEFQCSNNRKF